MFKFREILIYPGFMYPGSDFSFWKNAGFSHQLIFDTKTTFLSMNLWISNIWFSEALWMFTLPRVLLSLDFAQHWYGNCSSFSVSAWPFLLQDSKQKAKVRKRPGKHSAEGGRVRWMGVGKEFSAKNSQVPFLCLERRVNHFFFPQ